MLSRRSSVIVIPTPGADAQARDRHACQAEVDPVPVPSEEPVLEPRSQASSSERANEQAAAPVSGRCSLGAVSRCFGAANRWASHSIFPFPQANRYVPGPVVDPPVGLLEGKSSFASRNQRSSAFLRKDTTSPQHSRQPVAFNAHPARTAYRTTCGVASSGPLSTSARVGTSLARWSCSIQTRPAAAWWMVGQEQRSGELDSGGCRTGGC
ncbi:hypothetical protein B0J12DRAFT_339857 [Macrophomina phaseolina]|uniref:Uncharacterized protein n=1 Tax=Macrophomina phaseolina TaxID=35725 RepID=A0ABQ8GMG6_9PEZI|nr:hypothetical protein B0J12DRAFT_339857 [Macrophomina phaseolina]